MKYRLKSEGWVGCDLLPPRRPTPREPDARLRRGPGHRGRVSGLLSTARCSGEAESAGKVVGMPFSFPLRGRRHKSVFVEANSHGRKSGASISSPANGLFSAARIGLAACTQFELTPGWAASIQGGRGGEGEKSTGEKPYFFLSVLCVCAETQASRLPYISDSCEAVGITCVDWGLVVNKDCICSLC